MLAEPAMPLGSACDATIVLVDLSMGRSYISTNSGRCQCFRVAPALLKSIAPYFSNRFFLRGKVVPELPLAGLCLLHVRHLLPFALILFNISHGKRQDYC